MIVGERRIDRQHRRLVGQYSADDLAKGVNLGNVTTGPVYEFGQKVFAAINAKNQINAKRFRGTILKNGPAEEVAKLLTEIKEKQEAINKMVAEPKTYAYEVKLVK